MLTIHLGGTCNNSTWRDELVKMLNLSNIVYLNPVCENWRWDIERKREK